MACSKIWMKKAMAPKALWALPLLFALAACQPNKGDDASLPDRDAMIDVAAHTRIHFAGTEPFWSGQVLEQELLWKTPEAPEGTTITVQRFQGRGGISYSGKLGAQTFDMAITPVPCSDGMSDREYPWNVTLTLGGEVRNGCAWTDKDAEAFANNRP